MEINSELDFDGVTYDKTQDLKRLGGQLQAVFGYMALAEWKTLREIEDDLGYPQSSISARLRDFRKDKFGGHIVERRRRGEGAKGLFEYRVTAGPL